MNSSAIEERAQRTLAASAEPLICAYLYGSYARGAATRDSDVDVAVLLAADSEPQGLVGPLSKLRGALERALDCEVDVVDMRAAPPDLIHRILAEGRLLVDRAPDQRVAFEVRARNEYFDVLPYLRLYRAGQAA